MSEISSAAVRHILPDEAGYQAFLTTLAMYDTMSSDINNDIAKMIQKKKEAEILKYIATFHDHTVTCIGGNGRFAGYWQTFVGKGRENTQVKRSKTLEGLLSLLAAY